MAAPSARNSTWGGPARTHADDPLLVTRTPPAREPVAPSQPVWIRACVVAHAAVPGGTACELADDDGKPVGPGTRLGDGDDDVAQLDRTTAIARELIQRIPESCAAQVTLSIVALPGVAVPWPLRAPRPIRLMLFTNARPLDVDAPLRKRVLSQTREEAMSDELSNE